MTSSLEGVEQQKLVYWQTSIKLTILYLKNDLFNCSKSTTWFLIKWFLIKKAFHICFPQKSPYQNKKNNNNEHIYKLKRKLLNIQVDINTQLMYIRLKLTFNTCSCGIWLVTAFITALSKSMRISVASFPSLVTAFLTSLKSRLYVSSFLLITSANTQGETWLLFRAWIV